MDDQAKIDLTPVPAKKIQSLLPISELGLALPANMKEASDLAQYMAKSESLIPVHLREKPGACLGIIMDARDWGMNPFKLARMHMVVNGVGSYMSQAITAVINARAPIRGRLVPIFSGAGPELVCTVRAVTSEGQELEYTSPKVKDIEPKNSPLWKSDVQQQLSYYSFRAFARRYFPDLLMGVYDPEEAAQAATRMKDITPAKVENFLNEEEGETFTLKSAENNTGHVTMEGTTVPLNRKGEPITAGDLKEGEAFTFDKDTGEILDPPPHTSGLTQVNDREEEVITPEKMAANMVKAINNTTDKVHLKEWQNLSNGDINALPPALRKVVKKALDDKHLDLEPL